VIGVLANAAEQAAVEEFFELFKTPWEHYRSDARYDAVLCSKDVPMPGNAALVILYASAAIAADCTGDLRPRPGGSVLLWRGQRIPVYGPLLTFGGQQNQLLIDEHSGECAGYSKEHEKGLCVRIGYDLFREICILLTEGQPLAHARTPALELHIALLRELLTSSELTLVEIPPVPQGYSFTACLTHDVDHPSLRHHRWDHTAFGFLQRATIGSFRDFLSGRIGTRELLANWAAALKLPFVYLGWARDFWRTFSQGYLEIEKGLASTFFIIPFRDQPGMIREDSTAPPFRAVRYCAAELAATIHQLCEAGCEVGLHGIDAWRDVHSGRKELEEIRRVAGRSEVGVRMHWLYYDKGSPAILEQAGAAYDSTFGYNETVGYRAGTTQAYKPLNAQDLLELPLHVMDTALFYPSHLGLSTEQAKQRVGEMLENVQRFGGCITINWHDRSIAPERLWGNFYRELVQDLASRRPWFATAADAVRWFRRRRAATFEADPASPIGVRVRMPEAHGDLPGFRLRIYNPPDGYGMSAPAAGCWVDRPLADPFTAAELCGQTVELGSI
jgi:hypothetical protein